MQPLSCTELFLLSSITKFLEGRDYLNFVLDIQYIINKQVYIQDKTPLTEVRRPISSFSSATKLQCDLGQVPGSCKTQKLFQIHGLKGLLDWKSPVMNMSLLDNLLIASSKQKVQMVKLG